jgi:hypothetical protein
LQQLALTYAHKQSPGKKQVKTTMVILSTAKVNAAVLVLCLCAVLVAAAASTGVSSAPVCTGHKLAYKNMACCGDANVSATCVAPPSTPPPPTVVATTAIGQNMTELCTSLFGVNRIHHFSLHRTATSNGTHYLAMRHMGTYSVDVKVHNSTACEWRTTALSDKGTMSIVSVNVPRNDDDTNSTSTSPLATITTQHVGASRRTGTSGSSALLLGVGGVSAQQVLQHQAANLSSVAEYVAADNKGNWWDWWDSCPYGSSRCAWPECASSSDPSGVCT